ncbi:hypothetical protein BS78_02G012800 [Paspalum vaginatum]|nr:hypothetical protein BS78_02G012800 [Paspalum vaginatum]
MDMVAMLSKSLTVVSRLLTSNPGDGATRLHQDLASNMEVVNNLMGVLGTDSKGAQQLQEPTLEILTELAFGNYLKQQDFVKLFNALLDIAIAAEPNIAIVQVQHADTERATRLRGKASEALARLIPLRTARGILAKQDAIDLLAKVVDQILSNKMGASAAVAMRYAADAERRQYPPTHALLGLCNRTTEALFGCCIGYPCNRTRPQETKSLPRKLLGKKRNLMKAN